MAISSQCFVSRSTSRLNVSRRTQCARPLSRQCTVRTQALFGGSGAGGGNPFDMAKLMESVKKAQSMVQTETAKVQQELASTEFEGFDEEETVRVVISGNQEPRSVDVTDAAMQLGQEELSRRLTLAMKDAHSKSVQGMRGKMAELASKLGVPPNMANLPGMGGQ